MIIVDVDVPSIGRSYQFSIEESTRIDVLVAEMAEVICTKEQCATMGNPENLILCHKDRKTILKKNTTIEYNGIKSADTLILL